LRDVQNKLMNTKNYFVSEEVARRCSADDNGPLRFLYAFLQSRQEKDKKEENAQEETVNALKKFKFLDCASVSCTGSSEYFYHRQNQNSSSTSEKSQPPQQFSKHLVHSSVEWFADRIMIS
jgi:hypothetical protein